MVYDILVYTDTGIHENNSLWQRINSFKPELLLYNTYQAHIWDKIYLWCLGQSSRKAKKLIHDIVGEEEYMPTSEVNYHYYKHLFTLS